MVIAIDGPGGVGKTTVARAVADALGLPYLDTGATYRAAALAVLRSGVALDHVEGVVDVVRRSAIEYRDRMVHLDGEAVSELVRSPEVTAASSAVAVIADVRRLLVAMQRKWVADNGGAAVVEGRDIGTVVFPDAPVKIFLTARPEVRAQRRARDPEAAGRSVDKVAAELVSRDARDAGREVSPLRPADDAMEVDTSDLTIDEVVLEIVRQVHRYERRRDIGPL